MKQEKIIAASDILAVQMNHWTLFAVITAAAGLGGRKPPFSLWALCSLLPVLFFFIRRYTNGFLILTGSHLLCLALLFSAPVPGLAVKSLLCVYGIGLAIYSFSLRIRTKERLDEPIVPAVSAGIIAVSLFLLHYQGYSESDFYFVCMIVFYFTCYYIRCYFQHYLYFIAVNTGSTGYIPRREIFAAGMRLSLLLILPCMAVILLFSDLNWLSVLLKGIRQGVLWLREHGFFAFLASLFSGVEEHFTEPMQDVGPAGPPGMLPAAGEAGLFWQILEKLLEVFVFCFLFLLLLFALFKFVRMVRERFRRKKLFTADSFSDGGGDIRERYEAKREKREKKNGSVLAFLHPAEKIRRIYRQRIGAKRDRMLKENPGSARLFESRTARECGNVFQEESLSLLYEKARYSNMICTRDDVRKAGQKPRST